MTSSFDDVQQMMDESSAQFNPKRRSRVLRQPEHRIKAKRLQYNGNQTSASGEIDLRISSSCPVDLTRRGPMNPVLLQPFGFYTTFRLT
ncbi:unnamed protein product [Protopolystoma xenopodis]|uniref:Uncharacterized protein n=1 Tax=Protopolystoma xenopodis TaxID=117903 RepID=A0A3S4ZM91_9PLAT|nr:unnamed protein product [Protopolystoma xenopodis]